MNIVILHITLINLFIKKPTMGTSLSCPCGREIDTKEEKTTNQDIVEIIMMNRLPIESILYEYSYECSKICLIKSEQIEQFCNNRNLFKFSKSKDIYYNKLHLTNFLGKKETAMIILQYISKNEGHHTNYYENKLVSGIYRVENFDFTSDLNTNLISKTINSKTMKNFLFVGIIEGSNGLNCKLIFQRNMLKDLDVNYEIKTLVGNLEEAEIFKFLEKNKNRLLKAIITISNKNNIFIFEENKKKEIEYEYIIIVMSKIKSINGTECFLNEIVDKINDLQYHYKLTAIVSDETKVLLILCNEASKQINTDLEISDLSNVYN